MLGDQHGHAGALGIVILAGNIENIGADDPGHVGVDLGGRRIIIKLVDVLDVQPDEVTNTSLEDRLRAARTGLYVLLAAWARYEDEQNQTKREIAQEIRTDWGRIARRFLKQEDE